MSPHGVRRDKAGEAGAPPKPVIALLLPERPSERVSELIDICRQRASSGFREMSFRTEERVIIDAEEPFPDKTELLKPADVYSLYRALHASAVGVLAFKSVNVRLDPTYWAIKRNLRRIDAYIHYKGAYALIRTEQDIEKAFVDIRSRLGAVNCTGEDDPRVLPFHSFETQDEWKDLGTASEDEAFKEHFGSPASRHDDGGFRWDRADRHEYHGGERQVVAGRELPPGFHWDVVARRGASRFLTSHEVWKVDGKRPYINVYPNGQVRKTKKLTTARLVDRVTR